jgi:hypothetical protein
VSRPLGSHLHQYHLQYALLAVVPVGAQVRLDMTDEGRTQSLDLRTGRRTNAAAAFYPLRAATASPSEVWRGRDRTSTTVNAGITAQLTPWTEDKGWAPVGRAWLTGKVSVTASSVKFPDLSTAVPSPTAIRVDLGRDLRFTGAGLPSRLFPAGESALAVDLAFNPGFAEEISNRPFTVDVPEKLSKFGVDFAGDRPREGFVRDADRSDGHQEVTLKAPNR